MPNSRSLVSRLEAAERATAPRRGDERDRARWIAYFRNVNTIFAGLTPELRERIKERTWGRLLACLKGEPDPNGDPIWRPLAQIREMAWRRVDGRYNGPLSVPPEVFLAWEREADADRFAACKLCGLRVPARGSPRRESLEACPGCGGKMLIPGQRRSGV